MLGEPRVELRFRNDMALKIRTIPFNIRASIILGDSLCCEREISRKFQSTSTCDASKGPARCRGALQDKAKRLNGDVFRRRRKPRSEM